MYFLPPHGTKREARAPEVEKNSDGGRAMNPNPDAINDALSLVGAFILIAVGGGFIAAVFLSIVMHRRKTKQLEQAGRL
jgi:hypothetical protein